MEGEMTLKKRLAVVCTCLYTLPKMTINCMHCKHVLIKFKKALKIKFLLKNSTSVQCNKISDITGNRKCHCFSNSFGQMNHSLY